ncbi:HNH endonuclease family protein [Rugamonas rivuli]|uniref:TIGR02646 family protein n=1 Tax=Rugamonas rivuli TaxID=2743358 RepID=A0A843SEG2_9BURK|nr:hypothetical protein [Rugamonas rivuli]MQA21522.1 hypothetical protein [Rugamonas rivuli]
MLRHICAPLTNKTAAVLTALQVKVDVKANRADQYTVATASFKNKKNAAWKEIRSKLAESAPSGDSCYYCERDRFRDIEHILPKRHYPERCFDWENYLYACTICNQDCKSDKYAVIDKKGSLIEFDRSYPIGKLPPSGIHALINLRTEDPLDFLKLDFDTGFFVAIGGSLSKTRAKFTRDLFGLNAGELPRVRKSAFVTFEAYLEKWQQAYRAGNATLATHLCAEILKLPHPTVLVEIRRQAANSPQLSALIAGLPNHVGIRP